MPLPAAVADLLRQREVDHSAIELHPHTLAAPPENSRAVRTVLVSNGGGPVQLFYPADSIVDLEAVRRITGEAMSAVKEDAILRLCSGRGLQALPAVPGVCGLPAIIDKRLMEGGSLLLPAGDAQHGIACDAEQFGALADDAVVESFSVPLASLERGRLDAAEDLEEITAAVAGFTQLRIKARLEETLELPPLPDTAQRIIKLRVDPYADIKDLTDIVETDPPLAAQVVSWAASPYYAAPGRIKSVHDAIVRVLGFDLVLNLSLGLALGKTLSLPRDTPRGFTPYWQQAVYAATTVEALVSTIPVERRPTMGLAYLGGLLHNFGYLVLGQVFPPQFSALCRLQEVNDQANHCCLERHLLGVSREQIGAWLMRHWNMPPEVSTALRWQNRADYDGDESAYANVLFVAMRLLREHGIGDAPLEPIPADVYERLQLDPDKAREVISGVADSGEQLRAIAANLMAA